VISFALLASSQIPVLHAVGIVVAPGALLCLCSRRAASADAKRGPKRMGKSPHDAARYVKASAALHVAAGAAALSRRRVAVGARRGRREHLVLTAGGLWPRSRWLGRNWTACPSEAAAAARDRDHDRRRPDPAVTPAVLDLLDAHRAARPSSSSARRVQRHPALAREIARRGHACRTTATATRTRSRCSDRGRWRARSARRRRGSADVVGVAPRWFRAPPGCAIPSSRRCSTRLGLELVSWTRRGYDTRRARPGDGSSRASAAGSAPATSCCCTTATRRTAGRRAGRARSAAGAARARRSRRLASGHARRRAAGAAPDGGRLRRRVAMSSTAAAFAWPALSSGASASYRRAGRFALHFARGKLRWDPVFRHL
jgi:hypothetical protein